MGSEEQICRRQKIHAWKAYSEAERIALYRSVWGPSWNPRGIGANFCGRSKRDELIEQHLIVVEAIAGTLLRTGQNPAIGKNDLLQVGYAELIRTIDRRAIGILPLEKRIARNCKTAMIRFIESEGRERRYVEQGTRKVIRETGAGFGRPAGDEVIREADEFLYPNWLCGSAMVCRHSRADLLDEIRGCDLPEELAEIAHGVGYQLKHIPERYWRFYARPTLECLK